MKKRRVLVFDLDGTLIEWELAEKMYEEAYRRTVEVMRGMGIEIPASFDSYSFKNSCELAKI
jgi:FMN phosphatase YigB (HAD superfamily)